MKEILFVSSAQKEFQAERRAIKTHVEHDPLLRDFFDVFLFEDLPAPDRRADDVYLNKVDCCGIYVGLFGREHSAPTEREFDRSTSKGKTRLIFVKDTEDDFRQTKSNALIEKASGQLVRRRFRTTEELVQLVRESLVNHLKERGFIENRPYEDRIPPDASLGAIASEDVEKFVRRARAERRIKLPQAMPVEDVLAHLGVLHEGRPTAAAILLFGRDASKLLPAAEVRCMHFHGTEVERPAPSYQIFKGTLFDQKDRGVDFVLSLLNRRVGTRERSARASVSYDIPPDAVREAIVNAVAHRDYASKGSVQVSVFADRVEVRNPGELPPELIPEKLRVSHRSIPRNPRICEALFATRYIEKYGTGTLMMIKRCRDGGLPEPEFVPEPGGFVVTIWRDWFTDEAMAQMGLSERQRRAVEAVKRQGGITNTDYQRLAGVAERTALRDLGDLVAKGVFDRVGATGRGAHYVLRRETRQKPAKPATLSGPGETRQKAAEPAKGAPRKPSRRRTKRAKKRSKRT